jgi:hypothetical protein
MPHKDSYVTVNNFEHHAHFTEWNNAEGPVKFLKRVEELNVLPKGASAKWERSLGDAQTQWLIDSEFAEHNYGPPHTSEGVPIDGEGRRGEGAYGSRRPPPQFDPEDTAERGNHSQLNLSALSPHQFQRYINKLRQLSPEYREFILEQLNARRITQAKLKGLPQQNLTEDELLLYVSSQDEIHKLHRRFLAKHFSESYTSSPSSSSASTGPQKVERQPHRFGGLAYTHYSPLESLLTTHPQPGFILQVEPRYNAQFNETSYSAHRQDYVSLFSGLVARVIKANASIHTPFYNPQGEAAVGDNSVDLNKIKEEHPDVVLAPSVDPKEDPLSINNSCANMRIVKIYLQNPPDCIVGYKAHQTKPKEHLKSMTITAEAAVDVELSKRNVGGNPHRFGSFDYSGHLEFNVKNRFGQGGGGGDAAASVRGLRYAPPGVAGVKNPLKPTGWGSLFKQNQLKRNQGRAAWRTNLNKDESAVGEATKSEGLKNTLKSIVDGSSTSGKSF